jgi:hypothetical protein
MTKAKLEQKVKELEAKNEALEDIIELLDMEVSYDQDFVDKLTISHKADLNNERDKYLVIINKLTESLTRIINSNSHLKLVK